MRQLYCGIDLHPNNAMLWICDENGRRVYGEKARTNLEAIAGRLEPYRKELRATAVESTINWYWLGMRVSCVRGSGIHESSGLSAGA